MDIIVEKLGYPVSIKDNKNYHDYSIKPYIDVLRNKYPFIFNFLYYLIAFFHIILVVLYIFVYFTDNVFLLSILILVIYLVGNCCLSNVDNLLKDNKKLENGKEYSFLLEPLMYLFG